MMRAKEKRINDVNREQALGSIVKDAQYVKPSVVEAFNRPPYAPVLNFNKGVVNRESPSRWEED